MKFAHLYAQALSTPWFITEPALESVNRLLLARIRGVDTPVAYRSTDHEEEIEAPAPMVLRGPVAVISLHGICARRVSNLAAQCGAVDYGMLARTIEQALADNRVTAAILDIDSPGGAAIGCAETFAAIRAAQARHPEKMLVALTSGEACSAAYYLGAACAQFYSTESALTGNIGAKLRLLDQSGALAAAGIKETTIKSASMKDIGNPNRPATEAELQHIQSLVDTMGGLFVRDMRAARPQIDETLYETGLFYHGEQALAHGLVDGLVGSLDELIEALAEQPTAAPA